MNADAALELYHRFAAETKEPVAAATLAGLVYQAERGAQAISQPDALWGVDDVASFLNVSEKTVRRMLDQEKLRKAPLGIGAIRFVPEEVRAFSRDRDEEDYDDESILDDF